MHCKYEILFLLLLPGKESDSLIKFVFGSTWNFPVSDDSDGLREEWFNCFNFHCTYVYASFKYFMSVLSVQKLFARLCYYILSCILLVVSGHLGTEHMRHLGTGYWTSRYLVLEISVLNNKNNLIEFKNFLKNIFTCRRCLYKFLCVFF